MEQQQQTASATMPGQQLTACLRLTRGASSRNTWLLEDVPGGTTLQIGADDTCDWQIRAACVADFALTAMLVGGTLFVRAESEASVLLDGKPLGHLWAEVHSGSRIDLGLARIDVAVGEKDSAFGQLPQAQVPVPYQHAPEPVAADNIYVDREQLPTSAEASPDRTVEPAAADADLVRSVDAPKPEPAPPQVIRPSYVTTPPDRPRPSLLEGLQPALFQEQPGAMFQAPWKLAVGGLATALAYGGWLLLLDYI